MKIALVTTDNRDHLRLYAEQTPIMPPPQEALLQGFAGIPGLEVHVISCTQKPMKSPEKLAANIWFHLLHVPKIGWLRTGYQGCIRAIRRKLQELRPDIVHGQGTERGCALGAVFSGFPNVITIHGNMRAIARSMKARIGSYWWWVAILEQFALPRTNGVFCNSTHTQSLASPVAQKTWLVPNPLRREFFDTPLSEKPASSPPILLNIGTVSPLKRQLALLEVMQALYQEGHTFELRFIGAADPRNDYAAAFLRHIQKAECQRFARYLGTKSLPELIVALDEASALIHVPFEEAFGLAVAEALTRNLKFFGARVGGLRDVANGVEGAELFPLADPRELREAIARWLRRGCPRPQTAALEMKNRYHPDVIARRHAEIYREVTGRAS